MAPDPSEPVVPIDVDEILKQPFATVRRGYDPLEVQNFLMALASSLRASADREGDLRGALADAEARAEAAAQLDPSRLTALLGEETARIVETARQAADAIRAKAEEDAAHLRAEASEEAKQVHREAEDVLTKARTDAEQTVTEGRAAGAAALDQARAEAEEEAEAGRQRGREMVAEAQQVRERMLRDLARRRKSLRQQIEQLQVGRDRLLSAYEVVRETLAVATDELQVALPEAKEAVERMGPSVTAALSDAAIDRELDDLRVEVGVVDEVDPVTEESPDPMPEAERDTDAEVVVEQLDGDGVGARLRAPDPVEGRHSSAVRVIRTGEVPIVDLDVDDAEPIDGADGSELDDQHETEAPGPVPVPRASTSAEDALPGGTGPAEGGADPVPRGGSNTDDSEPEGTTTEAEDGVPDGAAARRTKGGRQVSSIFARMKDQAARGPSRAEPALQPSSVSVDSEPTQPDADASELTGDAALVAQRDLVTRPLEQNLARRLKRELSDEQNELLDSVRKVRGVPSAAQVLPAPESQVERYAGVILPNLVAAAASGADFADHLRGVESEQRPVSVKVTDLAEDVAAELVAPLRGRIERSFSGSEGNEDALDEDLRAAYREWKAKSIDEPSAHAVLAAFNRGLVDHLPSRTKVRWIVEDPGHPSSDCDDNALAGRLVAGNDFPTGHTAPPVHPFCRCLVVPEPR